MTQHRALPGYRPEAEDLPASKIVEVWELGFDRDDLIPLWVGEGDLPTPDFICEAAVEALRAGETFYTHKRGHPELRRAIADYTRGHYGVDVADDRISVTSAGINAIMLIMQGILGPGDELIAVTPVWPNAACAAQIMGASVVEVQLDPTPEGGFHLDLDKLAAACTGRTRAIFFASPSNPTGWMAEPEELRALLELCRARGIWLIADEVYHRFVYDRPVAPSVLAQAEPDAPVFVVHSFSKAWAMTGWRLGWLVHPASFEPIIGKLIEYNTSGAQPFAQAGALAAIRDGEPFVKEQVARCRQGAEIVYQRLGALPRVTIGRPRASFYSFFAVEGMTDSLAFAKQLLNDTGVGLAPGSAFGAGGEGFLRLCFASAPELLSRAMDRLERALS